MAKNRKFTKSQDAHFSLMIKHSKKRSFKRERMLTAYHSEIYETQRRTGVVMPLRDRKKVYKTIVED